MAEIPDSVFDDMAQWVGKEYFKYLKSNWNKEQWVDEGTVVKWVALSEPYAKWKTKKFGEQSILVQHGALLNSFNIDYPENGSFRIYNDSPYAKAHQEGVSKRNLPARPMLYIDEAKLTELCEKYIKEQSSDLRNWVINQFKNL